MLAAGARLLALPLLLAGVAAALAGPMAPAAPAAGRTTADLTVRSAKTSVANERLIVDLVALNQGRRGARANTGAVSWTEIRGRRAGRRVVLQRFGLAALRARRHRSVRLRVAIPAGTSGIFAVRVCLDAQGKVRERRRKNNCRSAGEVVIASSAPAVGTPGADTPGATSGPATPEPALTLGPPVPDTLPPQTTIDVAPHAVEALGSANFQFGSSEKGSRLDCRLDGGEWAYCSSPKAYSSLSAGEHTFEVRATDAAGNADPTPAAFTWTIDQTRPGVTITGGPTGTVTTGDASFTFTSPDDAEATFQCRLDAAVNWTACTSPRQLTGLADGSHTLSVRAVDPAGNVSSPVASQAWTVDSSAPETSLTGGPSGTVGTGAASFPFTAPGDAGATFECRLDGGDWAACTSPRQLSSLPDGSHTFEVRAVDAVGNTDATPASRTWTVDTVAPSTSISAGPSGTVAVPTASLSFDSDDANAAFECRLDQGPWAACTSPVSLTNVPGGVHTFEVRAQDAVGNTDATPASRTWTVDMTPPDTSVTGGPSDTVTVASASLSFGSDDANATFTCRLDGAAWTACTSPAQLSDLADGPHSFEVRAKDAAGNVDATPAVRTWTVDTAPPETTITSGPSGAVASRGASLSFTSDDTGATFLCRLDGGPWAPCNSPASMTDLGDGQHTFEIAAKDGPGNLDPTPASRTWTVDMAVPGTSITDGPSGAVASAGASLSFTSNEAGATFECRLDGGSWGACVSPASLADLTDGDHTFEVRANDAAGNTDATPASRTWTVDTVVPDTSITSGPSGVEASANTSVSFTSDDSGASFECRLDGGAWAPCTSSASLTGLADGDHTFEVRAKDAAGNTDATPASRTWTVAAT